MNIILKTPLFKYILILRNKIVQITKTKIYKFVNYFQ